MNGIRKERKLFSSIAHVTPWIIFITLVFAIFHDFVESQFRILEIISPAVLWTSLGVSLWHENALCSRCASATPLDPAPGVLRYRWALWLFHRQGKMILSAIVTAFITFKFASTPWDLVLSDSAIYLSLIIAYRSVLKHRPLIRGCPECESWRGDDGNGELETTPDPQPVGFKRP